VTSDLFGGQHVLPDGRAAEDDDVVLGDHGDLACGLGDVLHTEVNDADCGHRSATAIL
jgi:hypothetical protein